MNRLLSLTRTLSASKTKTLKIRFYNTETTLKDEEKKTFFWNISSKPFPEEITKILLSPIEVKPDGIIYLPEIKYRRILNNAFGPGKWGLMPRQTHEIEENYINQEYALFCMGQFVSQSYGEQSFDEKIFTQKSIATAIEGTKSNALMRCCKDLGIASELWDPNFIFQWLEKFTVKVMCENQSTKQKKVLTRRKDRPVFEYPWKEIGKPEPTKLTRPDLIQWEQYGLDEDEDLNEEKKVMNESKPIVESKTDYSDQKQILEKSIEEIEKSLRESNEIFQQNIELKPIEKDVDMFSSFETMQNKGDEEKKQKSAFYVDGNVNFGKYKGKTWKDVLDDSQAVEYLTWLATKSTSPYMKQTGKDALEYLKKKNKF